MLVILSETLACTGAANAHHTAIPAVATTMALKIVNSLSWTQKQLTEALNQMLITLQHTFYKLGHLHAGSSSPFG
jgi:hypothetical protein